MSRSGCPTGNLLWPWVTRQINQPCADLLGENINIYLAALSVRTLLWHKNYKICFPEDNDTAMPHCQRLPKNDFSRNIQPSHWIGNGFILMEFSLLVTLKVAILTTFSSTRDENFIVTYKTMVTSYLNIETAHTIKVLYHERQWHSHLTLSMPLRPMAWLLKALKA